MKDFRDQTKKDAHGKLAKLVGKDAASVRDPDKMPDKPLTRFGNRKAFAEGGAIMGEGSDAPHLGKSPRKSGTTVNIVIDPAKMGGAPPMPPMAGPPPPPPPPPMPPGPPPGGPPGMPPPGAGGPPGGGLPPGLMAALGGGGAPPMPRKDGGRVPSKKADGGAIRGDKIEGLADLPKPVAMPTTSPRSATKPMDADTSGNLPDFMKGKQPRASGGRVGKAHGGDVDPVDEPPSGGLKIRPTKIKDMIETVEEIGGANAKAKLHEKAEPSLARERAAGGKVPHMTGGGCGGRGRLEKAAMQKAKD